jgi:NAD(P)-dependent dehydrogenase (short-subunit alcohol dehydrogenase family)
MADVKFDFTGKIVLISGAARGVGREMAIQFCNAGAQVIAVDRDEENLEISSELTSGRIRTFTVDIRKEEEVEELMSVVSRDFKCLDICINNAAVAPHEALLDYRPSLWDSVYDVNCRGTFLMTKAAAKLMIDRAVQGRIINFSSAAALKGGNGSAAYSSSRAATEAFGRVAAIELARYGILVNTVRPGLIDTQPKPLPPMMKKGLEGRIPTLPLQRAGLPEEVGNLVMFLASSLSSYITGSVVTIDGGASVGNYVDSEVVDEDSRYFWLSSTEAVRPD